MLLPWFCCAAFLKQFPKFTLHQLRRFCQVCFPKLFNWRISPYRACQKYLLVGTVFHRRVINENDTEHQTMRLISLLAVGSKASSIEDLYKWCKSYINRGFEAEAITNSYCIGFFDGIFSPASDTFTNSAKNVRECFILSFN